MDLTRRGFIQGLVALGAAAALPGIRALPVLYGDGIHDDTEALQALLDGKNVAHAGAIYGRVEGQRIIIQEGIFKISRTLLAGRFGHETLLRRNHFIGDPDNPPKSLISFEEATAYSSTAIIENYLQTGRYVWSD